MIKQLVPSFIRVKKYMLNIWLFYLTLGLFFALSVSNVSALEDLADFPNPLMGTNNEGASYSRGNQYPAATLPFGMTAWAPVTNNAGSGWFFDYKDKYISGIKAVHQPSPWVGDYGGFEIMPMTGVLDANFNTHKSLRSEEVAKAYYYKTKLDTYNITLEVAPTSRAASFNITYNDATQDAYLLIAGWGSGDAQITADSRQITGWSKNGGNGVGAGKIYFCARFDKQFTQSGTDQGLAYVRFATTAGETINMKIGTSWISQAQATANLDQEIGSDSFEMVKEKARDQWNEELNKINIEGATDEQKVIFYSCFYRTLNFPKAMWEWVDGVPTYYSPYDGNIHTGKLWAGNGFWDTFRGVWPFFTMMYPTLTGEMLDGWVHSYEEGGWTVKWSCPGYLDVMIGTHTDSLFADAYIKGIRNFDYETAYEASWKNAMVQGQGGTGRVGLNSYLKNGYVALEDASYSAARTLEFSYDDFCVARFAKSLGKTVDYARFINRAMNYKNIWSPTAVDYTADGQSSPGFFRGRSANGNWRTSDANFYANEWGYEWIEGNAWHYLATPMQDGQGLDDLYRSVGLSLSEKLDHMFAASPDFRVGSYYSTIHEMQEAYDLGQTYGLGQYAHGNQPAQHMIYMYNHGGTPYKTQYWARKVMTDAYESGLADGHGYCGDEDNGQTSAWYLFSALGFYPATPGYPEYLMGSPLFTKATLHLENGNTFVINAPENSDENIYIQGAQLNGDEYTKNIIDHGAIMNGGSLTLDMGENPSDWGADINDRPSSLSTGPQLPAPDRAINGQVTASGQDSQSKSVNAFDKIVTSKWLTLDDKGWIAYQFPDNKSYVINCYTVTSANDFKERDPRQWQLEGSNDGINYTVLDHQADVDFSKRLQMKAFTFTNESAYRYYRLNVLENGGDSFLQIGEIELWEAGL
ncbi:MAG: alpha-1,2-mannosidase [Desulfobacteraceae bacterium]|nr:alpha-1,2-mannosidase [Desulfobacteraceae bacterium]